MTSNLGADHCSNDKPNLSGPATSVDSVRLIDEDHFVTCGEDGHVSVWGTMKKKPLLTVREAHGLDDAGGNGEANWVSAVAAMPMSDLIATGKLWLELNIPEAGTPLTNWEIRIKGYHCKCPQNVKMSLP